MTQTTHLPCSAETTQVGCSGNYLLSYYVASTKE